MSIPKTMRAAFIQELGGPEKIQIDFLPVPQPGSTDVLVQLEASAVNHVDLFVRSGSYPTHTPFPFVIGRDLVGTVVAIGPGVSEYKIGERVWCNSLGHGGRQGAFSEYAVVSSERLYRLPNGVDPTVAVPVLHAGATAYFGLVREAGLQVGETICVEGAGGGVGSAVVQLAKTMGARIIATASPRDEEWCRSCGADEVLDYHSQDVYKQVRELVPEGVGVWWDNSGRNDFTAFLPLMRLGGRVVVMAGLVATPVLPVGLMYTKDVNIHGFVISNAPVSDLAAAAATINQLIARGRLQARIGATFHLAEAGKAHEAMKSGVIRGRIVVVP